MLVIRAAISPRLAMNRIRIAEVGAPTALVTPGVVVLDPVCTDPAAPRVDERVKRDRSRHAIDHRRAWPGAFRLAIQRCTERVVVPIRAAAWLGLSSSCVMLSRSSHSRSRDASRPESRGWSRPRPGIGRVDRQGVANRVTTNTIHEVPASAVTEIGFVSIALEMETDCIDTVPLAQSTA